MSANTTVREAGPDGSGRAGELPTTPSSVVWSGGHSFVLEGVGGRARWAGVDDRGRARFLTDAELQRRGWSHARR
ncbi:hypothetical protein INP57_14625 [Saccharopolyspora sp. HNM0986]|uniref:hypothetical protein n=1 Tax=Saccharopolyspora galaxeae TaxID=2781241 RepID=UPI00190B0B08|nr:hypothetical protein [Saccharopolyspora sp. HNM0986]MBK0868054.1 hypothetical protein [Saccharopolyspora sp. HNM0986]